VNSLRADVPPGLDTPPARADPVLVKIFMWGDCPMNLEFVKVEDAVGYYQIFCGLHDPQKMNAHHLSMFYDVNGILTIELEEGGVFLRYKDGSWYWVDNNGQIGERLSEDTRGFPVFEAIREHFLSSK